MKPIFFFLLLLTSLFATAQTAVTGIISDDHKRPVIAASVSLFTTGGQQIKGTITDSAGKYAFNALPGNYYIQSQSVGMMLVKTDSFLLAKDSIVLQNIKMTADKATLKGVTVTATKKLFEMRPDKMIMNVENSILATGNSVFEVATKAPAVTVDKDDNLKLKGAIAQIYIDGKPSYLSGTQLTDYLKSLPADAVSTIEIISNPSSKYEAAGMAGIINIRLKKNKTQGINGTANAGTGYGKYPKVNAGINLNYRKKKVNIFGNAYSGYSESFNKLTYNSVVENGSGNFYQDRTNYWHPKSWWNSFKAGVDYSIGKKTVLGILVNANFDGTNANTDNNTTISNSERVAYQVIKSLRADDEHTSNTSYNFNLKTTIDSLGSEFSADMDYVRYDRTEIDRNDNNFYDGNGAEIRVPYTFRNNQPAAVEVSSAKIDYTKYITSKIKIEAGGKASSVRNDNNLIADSLSQMKWEIDDSRTNHFIYTENIFAAYANASFDFGKFSIQGGLRAEQTESKARSVTLNTIEKRRYLNLFPTLFISQKLNEKNDLNFSYTRRIRRPGYQSLNPFVMYVDPYTSFVGNPYLRPSFSNSLEIKHGYRQFLFTSVSYYFAKGVSTTVIRQDNNTGKVINIQENAGKETSLRMDISASVPIQKWWSADNSIGVGYNTSSSAIPGFSYDTKALSADFSSNHTFTLKHNYKIQTSLFYGAPTREGLAKVKSYYGWNAGVQKQFWNSRATIKLNAGNIIGTSAYRAHYIGEGLNIRWKNQWEGKRMNISFVYKFGSAQIKNARSRTSGASEETNRVNL